MKEATKCHCCVY